MSSTTYPELVRQLDLRPDDRVKIAADQAGVDQPPLDIDSSEHPRIGWVGHVVQLEAGSAGVAENAVGAIPGL